jgi:hypothetical protein
MPVVFNVYCDESCHLEHDRQKTMVIGGVWCRVDKAKEIAIRLREIKELHGLNPKFEVKWTKVSQAKLPFYQQLVDYFFDDDHLHFRALVVPDKALLKHDEYGQDHDTWYYKMYFDMLKTIFAPDASYRVYLDIKDTRGASKVQRLHEILCNNERDFSREIIQRVQLVHSSEVEHLQLADLLIGAVSYANRDLATSSAKVALVERFRKRSGYALTRSTLLREEKVNLFVWRAGSAEG